MPLKNSFSYNKHCLLCLITSLVLQLSVQLCWLGRWSLRAGKLVYSIRIHFTYRTGPCGGGGESESELKLASCFWRAEFSEAEHAPSVKFLIVPQVLSPETDQIAN